MAPAVTGATAATHTPGNAERMVRPDSIRMTVSRATLLHRPPWQSGELPGRRIHPSDRGVRIFDLQQLLRPRPGRVRDGSDADLLHPCRASCRPHPCRRIPDHERPSRPGPAPPRRSRRPRTEHAPIRRRPPSLPRQSHLLDRSRHASAPHLDHRLRRVRSTRPERRRSKRLRARYRTRGPIRRP